MDVSLIILLILVGLFVGLINTYAGAAAVLSMSLFTALGMPISVANGTNRIPVLFQTLAMSIGFRKQGVLDISSGVKLGIPAIIGSIIGSIFATKVPSSIFEIMLATMLILLIALLLFDPNKFLKPKPRQIKIHKIDYFWFFLIGLYGGFFHVGVGYFILFVAILSLGYDLVQASAIKGFVVLMYIPFTLAIFIMEDQVWFAYGLVHAIGNVAGALIATSFAKKIPMNLIRWSLVVMIIFSVLDLLKVISIAHLLENFFTTIVA